MKFSTKQAATLETVMERLGEIVLKEPLNNPMTVGLAKAYALAALAYAEGSMEIVAY